MIISLKRTLKRTSTRRTVPRERSRNLRNTRQTSTYMGPRLVSDWHGLTFHQNGFAQLKPVKWATYRTWPRACQVEVTENDGMLDICVIEPSQSEWRSPNALIPNRAVSQLFFTNYRELNAINVKYLNPTPWTDQWVSWFVLEVTHILDDKRQFSLLENCD